MQMQMVASAWRFVTERPALNLRIARCTACGQRFAWSPRLTPVACLICGGPLQGTRRYSRGTAFVLLQNHADVEASRDHAATYAHFKALGEPAFNRYMALARRRA